MKFRIIFVLFIIIATISPGMTQIVVKHRDDFHPPIHHSSGDFPTRRYTPGYVPHPIPHVVPLAPWQKLLNTAKDYVQRDMLKEAAPIIIKTFNTVRSDRKVSVADKKYVCSILMGNIPKDWRISNDIDRMGLPPFYTLALKEQKQIYNSVPSDWLFPAKVQHGGFLLTLHDYDKGIKLLKQGALDGDWETASFMLINRSIPIELQSSTIKQWRQDALRSRNPYMWLAVLDAQRHTGRMSAFLDSFDSALNSVRNRPRELRELALMCNKMRWQEGINKIEAISPSILAPRDMREALGVFQKAFMAGDRIKADAAIRMIHRDFPEASRYLSTYDNVRGMFRLGWRDMALNMIGDPSKLIDIQIKELLISESAFDKNQLNYWMKSFNDRKYPEQTRNIFAGSVSEYINREPERAVAVLQCGLRYFPGDQLLTNNLSQAYDRAGYKNRVIDLAFDSLKKNAGEGDWNSSIINTLWTSSQYTDYFSEVKQRIWRMRKTLTQGDFVSIARQLEQSSNDPAEALKWFEAGLRIAPDDSNKLNGASLYTIDAYNLRLRCLVKLNKPAGIRKALSEAKSRYPDYQFENDVKSLQASIRAEADAKRNNEIQIQNRLKEATPPKISMDDQLPYVFVMWIARTQIKGSGGFAIDWSQMPELKPGWRDSQVVTVNLFKNDLNDLMPFVRWVEKVSDKNKYVSNQTGNSAIESVYNGFMQLDESSLGAAYFFTAILTAPDDASELQIQKLMSKHADEAWSNLSDAQKKQLKEILHKEKLYPDVKSVFTSASLNSDMVDWVASAQSSTLSGIKGFFTGIFRSSAQFFSSTAAMFSNGCKRISAAVTSLFHSEPAQQAVNEAKAESDFEKAETSFDKTNALTMLSQSNQSKALDHVEKIMPQLLIMNGESDPPEGLVTAGRAAYYAVSKDRSLAKRASRILHQASGFSTSSMSNLAQYDSIVHFWAGENQSGLDSLFHRTYWDYVDYKEPFEAIACAEVPSTARSMIVKKLEFYLEADNPMPSKIVQAFGYLDSFAEIRKPSPEGLSAIAKILTRYISRTDTIIPREFLEKEEWQLYVISNDKQMPDDVCKDWYNLIEVTYLKAIQEPGDAKALVMPLKNKLMNLENDQFRKSDSYQRLAQLVKSLGC